MVTGLPHSIKINSEEIMESLEESVQIIIHTVKSVLEQTPPELSADIIDKGIILTGGGALLNGLPELIEKELGIPVFIAESPLTCVVTGTGIMLDNISLLEKD